MNRISLFAFLLFSTSFLNSAAADQVCAEQPVDQASATASVWSNMRNQEGSIRFESGRMLGEALKTFASLKPPEACVSQCSDAKPLLVFDSEPAKYLSDYGDKSKCEGYFSATKKSPYRYSGRKFASPAEFNDWFSDFSQGKGDDGSDLYEKCDGDCSPRYRSFITPNGHKLAVDAEVVCGPARDKDDNNYKLKFMVRWTCKA